jgi:hypothetical protein
MVIKREILMFTLFLANNILFVNCLLQPFMYVLQNEVND